MKPFIVFLGDPAAVDPTLVGEAAAELAALHQQRFPIAHAFVVTTEVFRIAPHGEITPDVEAAVGRALARLPEGMFTLRGSVFAPHHNALGVEVLLAEQCVAATQIGTGIELLWRSLSRDDVRDWCAKHQINPAQLQVAVVVCPYIEGTTGIASQIACHPDTDDALTPDETFALLRLVRQAIDALDTPRGVRWLHNRKDGFWLIGTYPI